MENALLNRELKIPAKQGTINDTNGLGTGFTHRLPGSGAGIAANDPNMDLLGKPGHLLFRSQRSDISQQNGFGRNLPAMDTPGVLLSNIGLKDFMVSARFNGVEVNGLSDQLLLYAGTSVDRIVRGGFHEFNSSSTHQMILGGNMGSFDFGFPTTITGPTLFASGDDIVLTLARRSGLWSLTWDNLTNPVSSGSYTNVGIPWLDSENDLYVGIMHMDARNFTSQVAEIDYFRVEVVPEPSTLVVWLCTIAGGLAWRRGRTQ